MHHKQDEKRVQLTIRNGAKIAKGVRNNSIKVAGNKRERKESNAAPVSSLSPLLIVGKGVLPD